MIDVGAKKETRRIARAQAYIRLNAEIVRLIRTNKVPKGNVLENARVALEAHENLAAADEANRGKFQDVLSFLKNRVEQG